MVYIVVESWYPYNKSEEVRDKFFEVEKEYPEDPALSKRLLIAFRAVKEGVNAFAVFDVKDGKYKEAVMRLAQAMRIYTEVEGYKYEMRSYITLAEGLALTG